MEHLEMSTSQHPDMPHVVVALKGMLKGDMIDWYHIIPMAIRSQSGIQGELWTWRFVEFRARQGIRTGYAFRRPDRTRAMATDYEPALHAPLI